MTLGVRDIQSDSDLDQSSYLSQISQIIFVEKKLSCGEILGDFATIYALSCGEKLSPKSTLVEKKWQIWGLTWTAIAILAMFFCTTCNFSNWQVSGSKDSPPGKTILKNEEIVFLFLIFVSIFSYIFWVWRFVCCFTFLGLSKWWIKDCVSLSILLFLFPSYFRKKFVCCFKFFRIIQMVDQRLCFFFYLVFPFSLLFQKKSFFVVSHF